MMNINICWHQKNLKKGIYEYTRKTKEYINTTEIMKYRNKIEKKN